MQKTLIIFTFLINLWYVGLKPFTALAQDVHFSQFLQTPLLINPALTGVFDGDIRAHLNYKNQWKSVGVPYKTYALSYDMSVLKKKWDHSYLGIGFFAFNDKAGDTQFGTTQFNLSLAGVVAIDESHRISAGLQGGFAQRSLNSTSLKWGNQFDQGVFEPSIASGETGDFSPFTYGDFSVGLNWNYQISEQIITNTGVALYHLNNPPQEFIGSGGEQLYNKLVLHADGQIGIENTNLSFRPSVLFFKQGPSTEFNVGTMVRYRLKEASRYTGYINESALSLGGYYRNGDSFIPSILFEITNFALGISYDINVSGLSAVSRGRGGVEISLRFINPNPLGSKKSRQGPSFL